MSYDQAAAVVRDASEVVVTTHIGPDGDGIGSGLALVHALRGLGKRVRFLCPSPVASLYRFLPGFEVLTSVDEAAVAAQAPAEVVLSCDAGDLERLGAIAKLRRTHLVNLDHHATNTRFGTINVVDEAAESSGVVVARLLAKLGVAVDRTIAECLYTTIVFDTGRFMHSNTTAHALRWTADLLDTGIDAALINRKLTYTRTPKDLEILRLALGNLRYDADPRIAGVVLTRAAIAEVGEPEDWGDLVEIPRSLQGNEIAFLAREGKDRASVRVSLRSNPPFEVGAVAQAYGGGGHRQAAGCTIPGALEAVLPPLFERLRAQLAMPAA
jgi:phosphoesterase RecJ-like protein